MANSLSTNPLVLTADLASFQAAQTLTAQSEPLGIRIRKRALYANASTVAGTVTVTDPVSGRLLLVPVAVAAYQITDAVLYAQDFPSDPQMWTNFSATGLTATKTTLVLWWSY